MLAVIEGFEVILAVVVEMLPLIGVVVEMDDISQGTILSLSSYPFVPLEGPIGNERESIWILNRIHPDDPG